MAEQFLAEIRMMSFDFAPRGWARCEGQLLPINQNQALFSLLGTNFGGNGQTTFALPDYRGLTPIHMGQGYALGQRGGAQSHTLILSEMPGHRHTAQAATVDAGLAVPTANYLAQAANLYTAPANLTSLIPGTISFVGGSQPHQNMQPFLTICFCIALQGMFPSRN